MPNEGARLKEVVEREKKFQRELKKRLKELQKNNEDKQKETPTTA